MSESFPKFSLNGFASERAKALETLEIVGEFFEDGEFYILNPLPCDLGAVYRLPKTAVEIVSTEAPVVCADGMEKKIHRAQISRDAPCIRLLAGLAQDFFGEDRHQFDEDAFLLQRTKNVRIAFTGNGEGNLSFGGNTVRCLGNPTLSYAKDLTVRGKMGEDKFRRKFSNEYQVWMDYAILIMGQRGIYIHEGASTLADNGGPSAGCIHVAQPDAETFYNWIDGPTRLEIAYPW